MKKYLIALLFIFISTKPKTISFETIKRESSEATSQEKLVSFISEKSKTIPLIILDFYVTWCSDCQEMGTIINKIENDNILFISINIEKNTDLEKELEIDNYPTFIAFKQSEEVERFFEMEEEEFKQKIADLLN